MRRELNIGSSGAPIGSLDWAKYIRTEIQVGLKNSDSDVKSLQGWIGLLQQYDGYKVLEDRTGRLFPSYAAFCTEKQPWGLGIDPAVLEQVVRERRTAFE